jgi:hypothetical protein
MIVDVANLSAQACPFFELLFQAQASKSFFPSLQLLHPSFNDQT